MKLSNPLFKNRIRTLQFLFLFLTIINYSSNASSVVGCDDFECQDLTFFSGIPYPLEMNFLSGDFCDNLSFNPDSLSTTQIINSAGITEYTVYNLETGDSCTGTIDIICLLGCFSQYSEFIDIGSNSVILNPTDLVIATCYYDEVFLPPYESGIFTEGTHDVGIYSPQLDDSCTVEFFVYSVCSSIQCDEVSREFYKDTLWPQDIMKIEECPDTLAYLIEILDDQEQILLSGNSIYLEEWLPDTVDVRITHLESGNDCVGELQLFHNCIPNLIDTLSLDFTGLENISVPFDSLFKIPCEYEYGPGFIMIYESKVFGYDGDGTLEFTNFSQDGKIFVTDHRTNKFVSKEIVFVNESLNLLFGFVFSDDEGDCWIDSVPESGPEGFLVYAAGETDTLYDYTSSKGLYNLYVPSLHTYEIGVVEFNNFWDVCVSETPIYKEPYAQPVHIGLSADTLCSYLTSDLTIPRFRRCFDNYIYIHYCNLGSDTAYDVILDFYFDEGLDIDASLYGFDIVSNTHYQLNIGALAPLECGDIDIIAFVDCDLELGAELCVEIELGPIPDCNDPEEWSGAALEVEGICESDSVRFIITNIGESNMTAPNSFIVIEDDIMIIQDVVDLDAGESEEIVLYATGQTYRLIADQVSFHPYTEKISALVKACADDGMSISTGFANSFVLDEQAPYVSIECLPVIGAYDPNDKAVTPSGAYADHVIVGDELLEYTIRFENTGTDTAFRVRVLDTIDGNLDLLSFRLANSSHLVEVEFPTNGIVDFIFENIELPDTSVNKLGAQGFVKYTIRPKENLPLETKIYNSAGIYFDFNAPIFTNEVDLQVGEYISTGLAPIQELTSNFSSPNPTYAYLNINIEFDHFVISNMNGTELIHGGQASEIDVNSLLPGIYLISIFEDNHLIGIDKFVKINLE